MTDHTKQPLDLLTRLRMSYAGKYSPLQVEAADAIEALIAERDAYQQVADKMASEHKVEREALQAENERLKAFAGLGEAMYEMTTTVHSPNIEFSEQLQIVPSLWTKCMEERDQLQAENERLKRQLEISKQDAKEWYSQADALKAKLDAYGIGENTCSQNSTT